MLGDRDGAAVRRRPHPVYLLVEVADRADPTDGLAEAVADAADHVRTWPWPPIRAGGRELWRYRESHTVAINTLGPPHKLDVTLPQASLAAFIDRVPERGRRGSTAARTWLFGHVGDGNIHVNVTGLPPDDDRVDDAVFRLVAELGGSISAEHGIGTAKKRWLAPRRGRRPSWHVPVHQVGARPRRGPQPQRPRPGRGAMTAPWPARPFGSSHSSWRPRAVVPGRRSSTCRQTRRLRHVEISCNVPVTPGVSIGDGYTGRHRRR